VALGVTLCVCPPSRLYHISTACHVCLGSEGIALYPVLSSYHCFSSNLPVYADSDDDEALFSLCVSIFTANLWLLGDTVTVGCAMSGELGCWRDE